MARGFFMTGTDTEIGKTVASTALIHYLRHRRLTCAAMKPVASGSVRDVDGLRNDDALRLIAASGLEVDYADVNPWVFEEATAPHLAARDQGVQIDLSRIVASFDRLAARADTIVVEGVGGWLVPLADDLDVVSLACKLDLPVILVVGLRLGCLNHALLSERAIRSCGCKMAGWIANHPIPDFPRAGENIATLERLMKSPRLATIRWASQDGARAALDDVDEAALMGALGGETGGPAAG